MPLGGATAPSDGKDHGHISRIDLLLVGNADGPCQATVSQSLTELGGEAITGIRQHAAETDPGSTNTIDLDQRDLGLGPVIPAILWHAGSIEAGRLADPTLRQKQPKSDHDRDFA